MKILNRPFLINPPSLVQLVKHSNGAIFRTRTTVPKSSNILTKDTINHPLWNPDAKVVVNSSELAKFNQAFGGIDFSTIVSQEKSSKVSKTKTKTKK